MNTRKRYYYAIVYKSDKNLALIDGNLPIYWNKSVATKRIENFNSLKVIRIDGDKLNLIISES